MYVYGSVARGRQDNYRFEIVYAGTLIEPRRLNNSHRRDSSSSFFSIVETARRGEGQREREKKTIVPFYSFFPLPMQGWLCTKPRVRVVGNTRYSKVAAGIRNTFLRSIRVSLYNLINIVSQTLPTVLYPPFYLFFILSKENRASIDSSGTLNKRAGVAPLSRPISETTRSLPSTLSRLDHQSRLLFAPFPSTNASRSPLSSRNPALPRSEFQSNFTVHFLSTCLRG